jgi:hypothetical protein
MGTEAEFSIMEIISTIFELIEVFNRQYESYVQVLSYLPGAINLNLPKTANRGELSAAALHNPYWIAWHISKQISFLAHAPLLRSSPLSAIEPMASVS